MISVLLAFWLGILTSISPCPLATNIAAVSFIGQKAGQKKYVLGSGFLYALGRIFAYLFLGAMITAGFLGSGEVARFLQKYMNEILGPILIILGLILLGWIGTKLSLQLGGVNRLQEKTKTGGIAWAFLIGALFAISFCPVSAGLFFGGLLPLALKNNSLFMLPISYGIGTALPVMAFAFIMAFSSAYVGRMFDQLVKIEVWIRRLTGTLFILVGVFYCLTHVYGFKMT